MTTTTVPSGLCTECGQRPAMGWVDGTERRLCLACVGAALDWAAQDIRAWSVDRMLHELWHRQARKPDCRWCRGD